MEVLLTREQLAEGVERLAREIRAHYGRRPLTIIAVLTGSVVLTADLIRRLDMPLRLGVIQASSYYGGMTRRGPLAIHAELTPEIAERDVLIVDDIFDTGHTLAEVMARLGELGPRSIRSAVLLRKHGRREVDTEPDYVGFEIPDRFVVGYGLDFQEEYRNLPYLAALAPEETTGGPL